MKSKDKLETLAKEITQMTPNTENLSNAQESDMNAAMASLDDINTITDIDDLTLAAEDVVEETIEETVEETVEAMPDDVLADDEMDDLDMEIDKAEAYAGQESATVATVDKEDIKTAGVAAPAGASRVAKPRIARDLSLVSAQHFVLSGDVSAMSSEDMEKAKASLIAAKPIQVKVAEKFENLFQSMEVGRAPSKYVMTAFSSLDNKETMSSAELIAAFKTSGVGEGTARSQTGQIMTLLPVLGVATRSGKDLTMVTDSNVATFLRGHITPAS